MIGLISALDSEMRTLVNMMENTVTAEYAGCMYYSGTLKGKDIVICNCGVGKVNAAMHTQVLIDRFAPDLILQNGVAGSLRHEVKQLDLVIGSELVYHDMQEFVLESYGPLEKVYHSDEKLVALAKEIAEGIENGIGLSGKGQNSDGQNSDGQNGDGQNGKGQVHVGRIATGDWFVSSSEDKNRIVEYTHALCTEMEGCAVAHTAYLNKVPFLVLRSISDSADEEAAMDFAGFCELATEAFVGFVLELITRVQA